MAAREWDWEAIVSLNRMPFVDSGSINTLVEHYEPVSRSVGAAGDDGELHALEIESGETRWIYRRDRDETISSPIVSGRTIYATGSDVLGVTISTRQKYRRIFDITVDVSPAFVDYSVYLEIDINAFIFMKFDNIEGYWNSGNKPAILWVFPKSDVPSSVVFLL